MECRATPAGDLATTTDPLGRPTWFTYDGLARLTSTRLYAAVEPGLLPADGLYGQASKRHVSPFDPYPL